MLNTTICKRYQFEIQEWYEETVIGLLVAMIICVTGLVGTELIACAEEMVLVDDLDYMYFTEENALFGYSDTQTKGVYLASGDSAISKINSYTIGVAGNTNAAIRCKVSVSVIVERYNMDTDRWMFITPWTNTNENAFTAGISKSLVVDSGYYYRVRSLHYAGSDSSSSYTNALYVGN